MKLHGVMHKPSEKFLTMTKFDPDTQEPLHGPLEQSWIADSKEQAIAQASMLGDDYVAVEY